MPTGFEDASQLPIEIDINMTGFSDQFDSNELLRNKLDTRPQFTYDYQRHEVFNIDGLPKNADLLKELRDVDSEAKVELRQLLPAQISDLTAEFLNTRHDQTEFGIYFGYTKPTFSELGYLGGKISPETTKIAYQKLDDSHLSLTTEVRNFSGEQIVKRQSEGGVVEDTQSKPEIFGGKDITQTKNTYALTAQGFKVVKRELRTNSPILAAELVIGYLERNKEIKEEVSISPLAKAQMIFYIADHPHFPMEVRGKTKEEIIRTVERYAVDNNQELHNFIEKNLPEFRESSRLVTQYCNDKVDQNNNSRWKFLSSNKSNDDYLSIVRLKHVEKIPIAAALAKDPAYLEKYFKVKAELSPAIDEIAIKLKTLTKEVLEFDYKSQEAKDLVEEIKSTWNEASVIGIAEIFTQETHPNHYLFAKPKLFAARFKSDMSEKMEQLEEYYKQETEHTPKVE